MHILDYIFPLLILQAFIWLYYFTYTNEGTILALLLLITSVLFISVIIIEHLAYVIANNDKLNNPNNSIRLLNKCLEFPLILPTVKNKPL